MISYTLVFLQFFIIFLMVLPFGTPIQNPVGGFGVIFFGLIIGSLALLQNKLDNFNIRPDIKENASLVTTGIYSYIRHPMYTSVLLMMAGVAILYPFEYEFVLYAILVVILLVKLFYEESLWHNESQEYKEYSQHTKRVIPYIF